MDMEGSCYGRLQAVCAMPVCEVVRQAVWSG